MSTDQAHAGLAVLFLADGTPCVVITSISILRVLADLLDSHDKRTVYSGGLPSPAVAAFVPAARHVAALAEMRTVPQSEPGRANQAVLPGRWITTRQAASQLGIGERAVRKRIQRGQLRAQRRGGVWFVDMTHQGATNAAA